MRRMGLILNVVGFIAITSLISCQKFEDDITFTVYKGEYKSNPRIVQPTGNLLEFDFYTHSSWKFDEEYTNGWSKLIGISHLDNHRNSARVGWRSEGDSIRICGYFYRDGERIIEEFEKLALDKWYSGSIMYFDHTFTIRVNNKTIRLSGFKNANHYLSNPYFGGKKPAPHDIVFHFRNVYSMNAW